MRISQTVLTTSPKKLSSLIPQPALAWVAILTLFVFTALGILAGAGSILRFFFPLGALLVGVLLYQKYPVFYISFTFWLYFLTPLIRRLIDYRSGWVNPSPVLLAPPLVALITLATVTKNLPKAHRIGGFPFLLALSGIFYAFLIGVIKSSPVTATRDLIDWLTPLSLGFHLLVHWRNYPSYRQNIQRTFLWGVFVMGVYGVVQYLVAPEWDVFWLVKSGMTSSAGSPEPLGIRVWSTMNSPGPFATATMAGLILLFGSRDSLRIPAAVFGYMAFLLSVVRSAWGGWLVAILIFGTSLKLKLQIRLIITLLVMALLVIPLANMDPFSERISQRLETFSNLEEDNSAQVRAKLYGRELDSAIFNYQGTGIGAAFGFDENGQPVNIPIDSGIIALMNTLGWFGSIPYLGGIALLFWDMFKPTTIRFDQFMNSCRALCVTFVILMIIANSLVGFGGIIFWGFSAMTVAGRRYYYS